MTVIAVRRIRLGLDSYRDIFVREGVPLELAYTDDEGKNYVLIDCFKTNEYISGNDCFLSTGKNGTLLFLATSSGYIYRSMDGGHSWNIVEAGVFFDVPYILITKSLDRIFAINKIGMIYSDDDGDTWNIMPEPEWNLAALKFSGG